MIYYCTAYMLTQYDSKLCFGSSRLTPHTYTATASYGFIYTSLALASEFIGTKEIHELNILRHNNN